MKEIKKTRSVKVGNLTIGGDAPVSIQSMTNTPTKDVNATAAQILRLQTAGCELIRVGVPDMESAEALGEIKQKIGIPLIADIHFDYKLAVAAIEQKVDKLRLNPGNIKDPEKIKLIADKAGEHKIPIRIGVNAGSLDRDRYGEPTPQTMVQCAIDEVELLESRGFSDIVISLKAFDVPSTIATYRLASQKTDCPLHLGITEAGLLRQGTIRSAIGIGALLAEGIGNTFRVSLTADPIEEIKVGIEILKALNMRQSGYTIVSCPTCARCGINLQKTAEIVKGRLKAIPNLPPLKIAIMGCIVNGPGEARDADAGIAGGGDCAVIFARGHALRRVPAENMIDELMNEVHKIIGSDNSDEGLDDE
jgi:(E)-4-hydroxy-3-methylbut-2-enyl-diphosphate synthase